MENQKDITITLTQQQFEDIKRLLFDELSRRYYWVTMDEYADYTNQQKAQKRYKQLLNQLESINK